MASLASQVAIVAGASSGIGKSVADRLAADGANVVITYAKSSDKAQAVVAAIAEKGGKALALPADFTVIADIRNLFQETLSRFGKLDILVISGSAPRVEKPIADVTEQEFDYAFAFNAKGNFFALQEAARHMSNGGRVVTFSTPYTTQPQPNMAVTAGSKAAVEQFTFALAKELGSRGIRVNAVMPGPTQTESFGSQVSDEQQAQLKHIAPLQRLAEPEEVANAVAFLVSEEASYITGHTLHTTGGLA